MGPPTDVPDASKDVSTGSFQDPPANHQHKSKAQKTAARAPRKLTQRAFVTVAIEQQRGEIAARKGIPRLLVSRAARRMFAARVTLKMERRKNPTRSA